MAIIRFTSRFIRNDQSIGRETRESFRELERNSRLNWSSRSATDVVQKIARYAALQQAPNTLRFPHDTPKYYMTMDIGTYSRKSLSKVNLGLTDTIVLPLPHEIADKNEVGYDEKDIGMVLGTAWNWGSSAASNEASAARNFMETAPLPDTLMNGGTVAGFKVPGVKDAMDAVQGTTMGDGAMGAAAGAFGNLAFSGPPGDLIRAYGYSPNQWTTVLLRGPKYKRYTYTWNFHPNSPQEAKTINNIVKTVQNAKCPELVAGDMLFKFPSIFQLHYKIDGQKDDHKYLFQFKPSVIESCDVRYMNSFYQGQNGENPPESVKMTCHFLELEFWLKGQYK